MVYCLLNKVLLQKVYNLDATTKFSIAKIVGGKILLCVFVIVSLF